MKLPEFLEQYPAFFRTAVVVWLVFSALMLGGFLTLRQAKATASGPTPQSDGRAPKSSPAERKPGPSIEQYITRTDALRGRFIELDDYRKSLADTLVAWPGEVAAVSIGDKRDVANILVRYRPAVNAPSADYWARVTGNDLARAFALREGDHLSVRGAISWRMGLQPTIEVDELTVLPNAPSQALPDSTAPQG